MSDLLDELKLTIVDGFQNRTLTSCSRWAARRRVMAGDFAGPYSDKHHPWVREMHDSHAPFNYAMKGAQLGVTEVAINVALYTIDKRKRDVIYVLPTAKNASKFSKGRFGTALALSPYLKSMFTDTNSVDLKIAGQNSLYIIGSRGDNNLKSIPASVLILDEVDEMEWKQIDLAIERLSGQLFKFVWGISTPTVPEHGIHKLYQKTTQEHFIFPCPHCSRLTELVWPDCMEIVGEHATDVRCHESFLKCKECKHKLDHVSKPEWLKPAHWEPMAPNANPAYRGFHINQLYSFTLEPHEIVSSYFKGQGDELATKEFHNSKLGLPFIGAGARITDDMLNNCSRTHSKDDPRPQFVGDRIITMGVDRGLWNYVEITEWFFDQFSLDLNVAATAKVLYEGTFLEEDFDRVVDQLMREWQVSACVVDPDPGPMEARRFARRFPGYVWLCRYRRGVSAKDIQLTDDEDGAPVATVDRSHWLSAALSRFKVDPPRITLPRDVSHEYKTHIKSLVSTYVRDDNGNPVLDFVKVGSADHFAHARCYAEIALPLCAARVTNMDISRFL